MICVLIFRVSDTPSTTTTTLSSLNNFRYICPFFYWMHRHTTDMLHVALNNHTIQICYMKNDEHLSPNFAEYTCFVVSAAML